MNKTNTFSYDHTDADDQTENNTQNSISSISFTQYGFPHKSFRKKIVKKKYIAFLRSFEKDGYDEIANVLFIDGSDGFDYKLPAGILRKNKIERSGQPFEYIESELFSLELNAWVNVCEYKIVDAPSEKVKVFLCSEEK